MKEIVNSKDEIKQDPTYIPEINELPGPDIQEIYTPKKFCRRGDYCRFIFRRTWAWNKEKKDKLSINLNHLAPEEGHEEYKMKKEDELNQKIKKL